MSKLIVSFGGGVNSAAMLVGMHERGIRPDLILFADTGGEKPETYAFVDTMRTWTVRNMDLGIVAVNNSGMYGTLEHECSVKATMPSIVFGTKSCSDKYKMRPQKQYVERVYKDQQVLWAVGIDAGESHRSGEFANCWHPLIEWRWTRLHCKEALLRASLPVPVKSACFFCPSSKPPEIRRLAKDHPDLFDRALAMEDRAAKNPGLIKIHGLGRHWSWRNVRDADENQVDLFTDPEQTPCMCFDGDVESD